MKILSLGEGIKKVKELILLIHTSKPFICILSELLPYHSCEEVWETFACCLVLREASAGWLPW